MRDNLNPSCLSFIQSVGRDCLQLADYWSSWNLCLYQRHLFFLWDQFWITWWKPKLLGGGRQTCKLAECLWSHTLWLDWDTRVKRKEVGRWRQWLTVPVDMFTTFQDQLLVSPLVTKIVWLKGSKRILVRLLEGCITFCFTCLSCSYLIIWQVIVICILRGYLGAWRVGGA